MDLLIRILKIGLSLSAIMILGVFLLRGVGLLTDEAVLSNSAMTPLPKVADEDNAYKLISFIDQPEFNFGDDQQKLQSLLREWNAADAAALLKKHQTNLALLQKVVERKSFKSNALQTLDFPNYSALAFFSNLALLKAKQLELLGDYNQAAEYLIMSLKFNQHVKRDANSVLISYSVGLSYQRRTLNHIVEFVQNADVTNSALSLLSAELDAFSRYENDGFDLVWSGEQIYSNLVIDETLSTSFLERVETYGFSLKYSTDLKTDWFSIGLVLAPEYMMQRGKLSNINLEYWREMQEQSELLCVEMPLKPQSNARSVSWFKRLAPNAFAEELYSMPHGDQFNRYFYRRCASNFHLNAIRLLISVQLYEHQNAKNIESLSELVPDYIDRLPVDPFSGKSIKFNSSDRTIYSYGTNFTDDGGDLDSLFGPQRYDGNESLNNPSLSIDTL